MKQNQVKLGVNLDHIATLRQARNTPYPDLMQAIRVAEQAGADGITLHLREDRRHIQDKDLYDARAIITGRLNMEMAATSEMQKIALQVKPDYCCIVPERRQELTTEGGLDVIAHRDRLADLTAALQAQNIGVSLFVEPNALIIDAAAEVGASTIELHTGHYANRHGRQQQHEFARLTLAAGHARQLGLIVNAGHGLHAGNVKPIAGIARLNELNIGHAIVCDALFTGLGAAIQKMRHAMQGAAQ